jgi:hypothetical protein
VATEKTSEKINWKNTAKEVAVMLGYAFIGGVFTSMGSHAYETLAKGKGGKVIPLTKVG